MNVGLSYRGAVILDMLKAKNGKVLSHRAIGRRLWKTDAPASWTTMIAIEIGKLRRIDSNLRRQIVNVHGKGYMFGCTVLHK